MSSISKRFTRVVTNFLKNQELLTVDILLLAPHDDVVAVDLLHLGLPVHFPGLRRPRDLDFVDAVEDLDAGAAARPREVRLRDADVSVDAGPERTWKRDGDVTVRQRRDGGPRRRAAPVTVASHGAVDDRRLVAADR